MYYTFQKFDLTGTEKRELIKAISVKKCFACIRIGHAYFHCTAFLLIVPCNCSKRQVQTNEILSKSVMPVMEEVPILTYIMT